MRYLVTITRIMEYVIEAAEPNTAVAIAYGGEPDNSNYIVSADETTMTDYRPHHN